MLHASFAIKCASFLKLLFQNNNRVTGSCKVSTVSPRIPFPQFPHVDLVRNYSAISKPGN